MRFPYGIANFQAIADDGHLYIDRTDRIGAIEDAGRQLLLLRPRRFGKSLWLSTLENDYDLARADQFERLFGHLAIGQAPTEGFLASLLYFFGVLTYGGRDARGRLQLVIPHLVVRKLYVERIQETLLPG